MSKKCSKTLLVAALVLACFCTLQPNHLRAEEDNRTPEERYQGAYFGAWLLCTLQQKGVFLEAKAKERGIEFDGDKYDVSACIEKGLKGMKGEYEIMQSLVKNKEGLKALENHYVAAILHIKGTHAYINEDESAFMARMNETKEKTDELWVRFEIAKEKPDGGVAENGSASNSGDTQLAALRNDAEHGDAIAQTVLGVLYAQGMEVPKDLVQAEAWFRKAANQGFAMAQGFLAAIMHDGAEGVSKDLVQAEAWARKSADQGNPMGQLLLSMMYFNGEVVPQDTVQAAAWVRKAAEQGTAISQFDLALLYREGMGGIPQDNIQAYKWFTLATASGDKRGSEHIKIMAGKMTPAQIADAQKLAQEWKPTVNPGVKGWTNGRYPHFAELINKIDN